MKNTLNFIFVFILCQLVSAQSIENDTVTRTASINYIVNGSGQSYGNTFKLRIQLLEAASDEQLWAESYEREIKTIEDFFKIQNQR